MDYSGKFPVDLLPTEELKEELAGMFHILIPINLLFPYLSSIMGFDAIKKLP